MKNLGLQLLFFTFYQLIMTILVSDFIWAYRHAHGGVTEGLLNQIHFLIWIVIVVEIMISVTVIIKGNENRK